MERDHLVCKADFPGEGGWIADRADESNPPGRELAEFLHAALHGYTTAMSEVWNEEDFGWSFNCDRERVTINVLVQHLEHWLIICRIVSFMPRFLRSRRYQAALNDVCKKIDRTARADSRFRDLQWFTREEYIRSERENRK